MILVGQSATFVEVMANLCRPKTFSLMSIARKVSPIQISHGTAAFVMTSNMIETIISVTRATRRILSIQNDDDFIARQCFRVNIDTTIAALLYQSIHLSESIPSSESTVVSFVWRMSGIHHNIMIWG